jgi:hypothetical protein
MAVRKYEDPCGDPRGGLELDMVPYAVDDLERRAWNRCGESLRRLGRHHVALGAGEDSNRAADVREECKGLDRLRGEHATVPTESPAVADRLERANGE